ncbi:MAG: sigma-70 family RNA polymerase sigma factor [Planctomycetes bacterium]|nr:sigma-70 family RNA polymerase sigma factor [Planctomycetota bacterium]
MDQPTHPDELERLALAWQAGDRAAFRELVLRTGSDLRIYVASFCDSRELVDEVLQQTYVALFERIGRYQPRGLFLAWIQRIAHNFLMDHWRRRRRQATLEGDALDLAVVDSGLADLEQSEERAAQSLRLRSCLNALSPRARTLIEYRHLEGRTVAELAAQFQQTVNALSVSLHRIRRSLRDCLERAP